MGQHTHALDGHVEPLEDQRLGQIVDDSGCKGLHRISLVGCDHDCRRALVARQRSQNVESRHVLQLALQEYGVRLARANLFQRRTSRLGEGHIIDITIRPAQLRERRSFARLLVNY
jgi:hypothetical protein